MDCDHCQPTLLDLAEGQLARDAAADVRAHLRGCASCRGAFDRLAAGLQLGHGLELVAPPQAVIARLHAMAEQKARKALAQRSPQAATTTGAWRSLLDFVSRFAMARQVGMVMISLLIVAVGLWSLPQLRHVPTVAGGTVVNPDSGGEAAPAVAGVRPAQRLDLKVDVRAGRIRSKDDEAQITRPPTLMAAEPAKTETIAAAETQRMAGQPRADPARALDDIDSLFEPEAPREKAVSQGGEMALEKKRVASPQRGPRPMIQAPARADLGALARRPGVAAEEPNAFPRNQPAAAPMVARHLPQTVSASSPAPKASAEGASSAADSTSLARAREPVLSRKAARVNDKENACGSAQSRLERILAVAPASVEAGEALIEMAQCRRQLGDEVSARALLERAAGIAPVSERAKALLSAPAPPVHPAHR